MKLVSFKCNGAEYAGAVCPCGGKVFSFADMGYDFKDMNEFIEASGKDASLLPKLGDKIEALVKEGEKGFDFASVELLAPIPKPRQDVICLGINYADHAEESARFKKESFGGERTYPIYFSKRVNEAVADKAAIPAHEAIVTTLDYEAELAVVIGRDAKNVSPENAYDYVLGYTILNDVTDREIQMRHKQWYFGKSLDGFTPIGPCIVTEDCFQRPPILAIKSYVNGELRQNASTEALIFDIAYIISELSAGMTLKSGTIIATGTPAGVGMGFQPPRFLKHGDTVVCEIEGIGSLENTID